MIRRRHTAITAKKEITNYFRLTSEVDENTITIAIGASVTTTHLKYLEYSLDEGQTWTRKVNSSSAVTITAALNTNESILLRGSGIRTAVNSTSTSAANRTDITGTGNFKAAGCLMTLLSGNKWSNANTPISNNSYVFARLFYSSTKLTDASNLIFPPDVTSSCYRHMFYGCTSLREGPTLPALTLATSCYHEMFKNCTAITYIKMLATNIINDSCLSNWMPSPRAGLEFHRNPEATWWIAGASGIPAESILFDDTEPLQEKETFIDPEVQRIALANWGNRIPAAAANNFKNSIKIGGVDGKILKRLIAGVLLIVSQFTGNTTITDLSDFDKFINLKYIGSTSLTALYSSFNIGFYNCTSLKYITLPDTLISLGGSYTYSKGCFMNTKIESIYIPDNVTTASDYLFYGCTQLKTIRWGNKLPVRVNTTSYYTGPFYGCTNLTTIENYPTVATHIAASSYRNCSKLDISLFYPLLQQATYIGEYAISGAKVANLPNDLILYNITSATARFMAGIGRRKLYLPKCTSIVQHSFNNNTISLVDLGNVTGSYFYPGNGGSSTNTVTVILRSTAVPTFSTFNKTNVRRIYVYDSIIDDFKADSKCSTAASITYPIGGEEWATEFGSSYEYADYPVSDPVTYNETFGGSLSIIFPMYNPDITLSLQFKGSDYRSIVLPFADIYWEYTRMGGDEFREITGVTATVDGEGNLTGFTVQSLAVTGNITPNKPYLVTSGMNGDGISGEYYTEILHSDGVVQPTNAITDEFTDNGYKFSFTGTYNFIDNMEGKYAFDGTNWNLCSSSDTMKATYVYMEIIKLEE